jgi:hypothetical protein
LPEPVFISVVRSTLTLTVFLRYQLVALTSISRGILGEKVVSRAKTGSRPDEAHPNPIGGDNNL